MNGASLLDTDVLVDIMRQTAPAQAWFGSLTSFPPISGIAALAHANLRLSSGLGLLDAITAAIAVDLGMTIGTFNARHFAAVPGLSVQQPYLR